MILVISHPGDDHAVAVLARLRQIGAEALMLDTARFPRETRLSIGHSGTAGSIRATIEGAEHDLARTRSVWWRRPLPFVIDPEVGRPNDSAFAYGECSAAISGLWSCLDARWMNDPERDEIAGRKVYQLKRAAALGLTIPRTLVTNDPAAARAFVAAEAPGGTIYKSFSATEEDWRETRLLREEEAAQLDAVRYAPVIFQEHVEAVADLRVTVVGDRIFPAEIVAAPGAYPCDYRMTMDAAAITAHILPQAVEGRLRGLMADLGLSYGAIDLRLRPDGDYVFLEVNPAGQWLFIEQRTAQPITEAVADHLVDLAGRG